MDVEVYLLQVSYHLLIIRDQSGFEMEKFDIGLKEISASQQNKIARNRLQAALMTEHIVVTILLFCETNASMLIDRMQL